MQRSISVPTVSVGATGVVAVDHRVDRLGRHYRLELLQTEEVKKKRKFGLKLNFVAGGRKSMIESRSCLLNASRESFSSYSAGSLAIFASAAIGVASLATLE